MELEPPVLPPPPPANQNLGLLIIHIFRQLFPINLATLTIFRIESGLREFRETIVEGLLAVAATLYGIDFVVEGFADGMLEQMRGRDLVHVVFGGTGERAALGLGPRLPRGFYFFFRPAWRSGLKPVSLVVPGKGLTATEESGGVAAGTLKLIHI